MFGSANVTSAGLGISNNPNAEVSLFLKSTKENILDRIGLKLSSDNKKALSQFVANNKFLMEQEIVKNNQFSIKILAAEVNYSALTIYTDKEIDTPVSIAVYDNNNNLIKKHTVEILKEQHEITLDTDENFFRYVQILSIDGNKKLSNKIFCTFQNRF